MHKIARRDSERMYREFVTKAYLLYLNARYKNEHWYTYYQQLRENQWWSRDEIAALQLKRLQALLRHAYQNVPYYNQKFAELGLHPDDIKTLSDLTRLPILTKKDVRENLPALVARNFPKDQMIPYSTGGSTGEPLQFYITEQSLARGTAAAHLAYSWYGYEQGDKAAYLWGSPREASTRQSLSDKICNLVFRTIHLDAFDMSENRMGEFAQRLAKFKPKVIIAYASAAYLFARYLQHKGIESIRPGAVITQAEKLFPHQRRLMEEVFGCEVFDFYGSREVQAMAAECPEHSGYHISAENVILEFVKDNQSVSPGEMGKILATDLHNYAMPFIRYENGDLGVPSDERCPCGRGLPLMKEVIGRITDRLVIGNKFISSPALTLIFKNLPIEQYQLVQESETELTIKIVKREEYCDKDTERIRSMMQTYVGSSMKLNIQLLSMIPPTESGKYRFIISKVPSKF